MAGLSTWSAILLQAEDWTTTDGKVYQNVTVVKAEPDAITILDRNGGALVPLAKLPPDLQKRFNYDPAQAKIAAAARTKENATSAKALQAEAVEAQKKKAIALAAQQANEAKAYPTPTPTPAQSAQTDSLHSNQFSLQPDNSDPNHHRELHYPFELHNQ